MTGKLVPTLLICIILLEIVECNSQLYKTKASFGKCINAESCPPKRCISFKGLALQCAHHCFAAPSKCISWSHSRDSCNISFTSQAELVDQQDCTYWSKLNDLNLLSFWRLNNHSKGINYANKETLNAVVRLNTSFSEDSMRILGTNGGLGIHDLTGMHLASFSIALWIKPYATTVYQVVFEAGTTSAYKFHLWLWPSPTTAQTITYYLAGGYRAVQTKTNFMKHDEWNFIAFSVNTTMGQIFRNSSLESDLALNGLGNHGDTHINMGNLFYIGGTTAIRTASNQQNYFNGEVKCAVVRREMFTEDDLKAISKLCD